ncbi:conserved hypothetical protein [Talaromyces stipitatus ATCC 10500]|uniref:Zn(2)-C6 fungal-type domain-containing protein n=1 Tax=Talaromyces stipitatus (strain ATCC 10500 / CBS 375.48 / QM 6759 / NRRL 1006) TaxID=441959 RepID=B8M415_TALSN|nr:uncharacterized protein TSTA_039550 [Talaromyces stipitatus ATCC 10500]EED20758.1 conserved hypothetical protein [Talaromyces stipitatus ATCC 10500]
MSSNNPITQVSSTVQRSWTAESKHKTRKNVSSACRACKARKLKCSGIPPCETCVKSKQECIIDAEGDQRRKLNLKRKVDSLENDRQFLIRLLESLRTGKEGHITELLSYIRSSSSLDAIKSFLDSHNPQTEIGPTPHLTEIFTELERLQQSRQGPPTTLAVRQFADTPLVTVPAKPWTTATSDDTFVSHLISLWLTWQYPWFNCIDPVIFINAMQSKDLQSSLCSPFLVNAMLAQASFFADNPEACAISGDVRTKGNHFYTEAKRLLDDEEGRISIPSIQGLGIMFECACAMGKDRAGWVYAIQAVEGMRTIRRKQTRLMLETGLSTANLELLIHRIELSHFNIFVSGALVLQIPPQVKKPFEYCLATTCDIDKDVFVPYPRCGRRLPAHNNCILNTSAQMGEIVWDISTFIGREEGTFTQVDLVDGVQKWHARLTRCWELRSRCIDCERNPVPGIFTLYMYYHTIIITMYAFLKTIPSEADDRLLERAERAQQICLSSAHTVAQLTKAQQLHWGPDPGPLANAHFITISLYVLMEDLKTPESHQAFMSLCRAHIHYARRWPLHRGTARMVQLTAQRMKDPLPHDVVAHFREFEERYWKPDSERRFSSRYPNFAIAIRRGVDYLPDDLELDAFLEKWVNLDDETRMD